MKKLTAYFIFFLAFGASAQNSLFFDLNVGGRFLGNVSDSSTLTPGIHLDGGVGYMFNPIWGIKGDLGYDTYRSFKDNSMNNEIDRSYMIRASLQGLLSLSELFEFESREFELMFHAGFGFASQINPSYKTRFTDNGGVFEDPYFKGNDDMINVIFGISPKYRIRDHFMMSFDLSGLVLLQESNFVDAVFDNTVNQGTGFILNASVGITYEIPFGASFTRMR